MAKFHRNIHELSLSENIAKSLKEPVFGSHFRYKKNNTREIKKTNKKQ